MPTKLSNIENFITKSTIKHNNVYDYSPVYDSYSTSGRSCNVLCVDHGIFEVTPNIHIRGSHRCPVCYPRAISSTQLTSQQVIDKFVAVHKHRYTYNNIQYHTMHSPVVITCTTHGDFSQTPADHIYRKAGCPACSGNTRINGSQLLQQFNVIHGGKYTYPTLPSDNLRNVDEIEVVCHTHGSFYPTISNHKNHKSRCPVCYPGGGGYLLSGQDNDNPCVLYVVRTTPDESEQFIKVGITQQPIDVRLRSIPYQIELVEMKQYPSRFQAQVDEQHILKSNESCKYVPNKTFSGHTECLQIDCVVDVNCVADASVNHTIPHRYTTSYSFMRNMKRKFPNASLYFEDETVVDTPPHMRVYARRTDIVELDRATYANFVNLNHHQSADSQSTVRLGLSLDGVVVMVMSFGTPRYTDKHQWELIRLCTVGGMLVVGGASKLFNHFITNYNPPSVISYCDWRLFSGTVYSAMGFDHINTTAPKYYYYKDGVRYNRQQFQKHKLGKKLEEFDEELSESVNMANAGYTKVYDAGQLVFVWTKNPPIL